MSNITIVGGGLVGSLLAIFLAKRGHQVSVFVRRPDPRRTDVYAGRSINLVVSHRGWTALRAAGVEEAVKQITVPVYARMMHDRDGKRIAIEAEGERMAFALTEDYKRTEQVTVDPKHTWRNQRDFTYQFIGSLRLTLEGDFSGRKTWADFTAASLRPRA